jgi:coronin-1B/1C/6
LLLTQCQVFLWRVPENFTVRPDADADDIQDIAPVGKLAGHPKYEIPA